MLNFTIKKETFDKIITISAKDDEKSGHFEYSVENIPLCFNEKTKIKKISIIDYKKLCAEAKETKKLLSFCKKIFALFEEER